jgi:phospholipase C
MAGYLDQIEHIVVLIMENRSFDHMLGYLTLEEGRADVDGLTGKEFNRYKGNKYAVFPLSKLADAKHTVFPADPNHYEENIKLQLKDNNNGYVEDFDEVLRREKLRDRYDPGLVMGYNNALDLPVFDHLAREFCVCDRWFGSLPGQTLPNRLYALAGDSAGDIDNPDLLRVPPHPIIAGYTMKTIFELLPPEVSWRYYSHDFAMLRVFKKYRFSTEPIARIDAFYEAAEQGELPAVTFIDPNFIGLTGPRSDDHPGADIRDGQNLVGRIYNALLRGGRGLWQKTLFVVYYDEHGGFYDHVHPEDPAILLSPPADDRPELRRYGPRVPALVISPWVRRRSVSRAVYDHTSVLKTILMRFCRQPDGSIPKMTARVDAAADLGPLLALSSPRADCAPAPLLHHRGEGGGEEAPEDKPEYEHHKLIKALMFLCREDKPG